MAKSKADTNPALTPEQITIFARAWTQETPTLDPADIGILGQYAPAWQAVATIPPEDRPLSFYPALQKAGIRAADIGRISGITTTPPDNARPADDPLIAAHRTDAGNAECLAHRHGEHLRYCHTTKTWHHWNGAIWAPDQDQEAERRMLDTVRARYLAAWNVPNPDTKQKLAGWAIASESAAKQQAGLRSAQSLAKLATTIDQYDTAPMLATARNGITVNLATGETYQARREDMITKTLGTKYDPAAKCPRWLRHLGEVFEGNANLIAYIKRAVGYSLTGDTREQKAFILYGHGANGKSVTLTTLRKLLGDYGDNTPFDTFDADTTEARHDLAKMRGARFVTVIEANEDRYLNEARIKAITGGEQISSRALYQMPIDYRPTFKLWIALNHLPVIRGTDKGIWRRIDLVAFNRSFEGAQDDKGLEATLVAELPGILNWAIEGAREWVAMGLAQPDEVTRETNTYRQTMDIVQQWLDECATMDARAETAAGMAYQSYGHWCAESGLKPEAQGIFTRRVREKGVERMKRSGKVFYKGLGLLSAANAGE